MKKLLSVLSSSLQGGLRGGLLILALLTSVSLWAYDFQSGDLYYDITSKSDPYTVSVIGHVRSTENYAGLISVTIPETVTHNDTTYNVTQISSYAFNQCQTLISVVVGNNVSRIAQDAFSFCPSLNKVVLGNKVEEIENWAFDGCTSLHTISIPTSLTNIGLGVFAQCPIDSIYWNAKRCRDIKLKTSNDLGQVYVTDPLAYNRPLITSFVIGDSVEYIPTALCYNMTNVKSITIPESVTAMGSRVFEDCSSLVEMTIPNSVTSIGGGIFAGCSALKSVKLSNNIPTITNSKEQQNPFVPAKNLYGFFKNCSSLETIIIPNSVTAIASGTFNGCTSLRSVTLPPFITKVPSFNTCSSLAEVYIKAFTPPTIEEATFTTSPTCYIPCGTLDDYKASDWANQVGHFIEGDCEDLKHIYYTTSDSKIITPYKEDGFGASIVRNTYKDGKGVMSFIEAPTSIGEYAFYNCSTLTSITLPNSINHINNGAFCQCENLTSIDLGDSITTIGADAFVNCLTLPSITIPNSVTSIGDWAFYQCKALNSISIPNSVTTIGNSVFCQCYALTSIDIGNGVTSIGADVFFNCNSLTSVTIPNSVTQIGGGIFYGCSALESVVLSENITSLPTTIEKYEGEEEPWYFGFFAYCYSLKSITIPKNITNIGNEAFLYCNSLTSITCEATNPPDAHYNAFYGVDKSIPLYVQYAAVDEYQSTEPWSEFYNILPFNFVEESVTACDSYEWNGVVYTKSGDYTYNTTTEQGCERVEVLHLTINKSEYVEESVTACDSYEWHGMTYTISGDYTYTTTTDQGCERVEVLHLTILPEAITDSEELALCPSELPYEWYGQSITEAGTYSMTEPYAGMECDSVIHELTVNVYVQTLPAAVTLPIVRTGEAIDVSIPTTEIQAHIAAETWYAPNAEVAWYIMENSDWAALTTEPVVAGTTQVVLKYAVATDCGNIESDNMVIDVTPTSVENTHTQSPTSDCQKILYEDHIYILRDGKIYSIMGQEM